MLLFALSGCDPTGDDVDGGRLDAGIADVGPIDGGPRCPDVDLSSMVGVPVLASTTDDAERVVALTCGSGEASRGRFYVWTAPRTGDFVFTTAGADFDSVLAVMDGATCSSAELACGDNLDIDLTSRVALRVTAERRYVIAISGFDAAAAGYFALNIIEAPAMERDCADTIDEDLDGNVDCADPDCAEETRCIEICDDDVDNDGNGDVDCDDIDCEREAACLEICDDDVDNDGNGDIDCFDFDCVDAPACPEDCDNDADDDRDGATDCQDARCFTDSGCVEIDCGNEIDDDGDGATDCGDLDCELDLTCGGD
jgi:hypothetical protein